MIGYRGGMTRHAPAPPSCPFCHLPSERIVAGNDSAVWLFDGFPVSPGHALVITRRHIGSIFETLPQERVDVWALLEAARTEVQRLHAPEGFNVGINDGPVAGQTVPHLHIHLIPRYSGDCPDPRGGLRWILPEKADYWSNRE